MKGSANGGDAPTPFPTGSSNIGNGGNGGIAILGSANGGNGGIAVKGSADGQNGNGTNNGTNGGIVLNGNQPAGCQISIKGICKIK